MGHSERTSAYHNMSDGERFRYVLPVSQRGKAFETVEGSSGPGIDVLSNRYEHAPWLSSALSML
jgi:hypothetical protein